MRRLFGRLTALSEAVSISLVKFVFGDGLAGRKDHTMRELHAFQRYAPCGWARSASLRPGKAAPRTGYGAHSRGSPTDGHGQLTSARARPLGTRAPSQDPPAGCLTARL
jgi:hypothetical protein